MKNLFKYITGDSNRNTVTELGLQAMAAHALKDRHDAGIFDMMDDVMKHDVITMDDVRVIMADTHNKVSHDDVHIYGYKTYKGRILSVTTDNYRQSGAGIRDVYYILLDVDGHHVSVSAGDGRPLPYDDGEYKEGYRYFMSSYCRFKDRNRLAFLCMTEGQEDLITGMLDGLADEK